MHTLQFTHFCSGRGLQLLRRLDWTGLNMGVRLFLKKHCLPMYKGLGSQLTESTAVVVDTQISPSQHRCLGFPSQCLPPWMARKNMRPRSLLLKMASKSPLKTSLVSSAQLEVSCRSKIQFIYFLWLKGPAGKHKCFFVFLFSFSKFWIETRNKVSKWNSTLHREISLFCK